MKHLSLTGIDRVAENDDFLDDWCLSQDEIYSDRVDRGRAVGLFLYDGLFHKAAAEVTNKAFYSILPKLSKVLNEKCGAILPDTFWEILVGAWLRQYLDVLYQRLEQLKSTSFNGYSVKLIAELEEEIPFNSDDFSVLIMQDKLNHQLMGQIIVEENLCAYSISKALNVANNSDRIGRPKRNPWMLKIASLVSGLMAKNARSVICNSYVSNQIVLKGFIKRFWTPVIYAPKFVRRYKNIDRGARCSFFCVNKYKFENKFERLAFKLLGRNLPAIFFEDLNSLIEEAHKTYPKKMTKFITANPNSLGELVKAWIGLAKIYNKCQYIVIQHGSNYGQSEVNTDEDVELSACDIFLTAGWTSEKINNKYSVSVINTPSAAGLSGIGSYLLNKTPIPKTSMSLLILPSFPRYYYTGWSAPQGSSFRGYLEDLLLLNKLLVDEVNREMVCRDYHYDYGWKDRDLLGSHGYKFHTGNKRQPLSRLMRKSCLNIFAYNSTAFLQSLANNYITCAFWREESWGWRSEAKTYLVLLKEAGIYHDSPESLANFLNSVRSTEQLYDWWSLDKTQDARLLFCKEFANTEGDELGVWKNLLGRT
jgi:putative transferase (TIGR04331 family)